MLVLQASREPLRQGRVAHRVGRVAAGLGPIRVDRRRRQGDRGVRRGSGSGSSPPPIPSTEIRSPGSGVFLSLNISQPAAPKRQQQRGKVASVHGCAAIIERGIMMRGAG